MGILWDFVKIFKKKFYTKKSVLEKRKKLKNLIENVKNLKIKTLRKEI